jgi:hypothetical protein
MPKWHQKEKRINQTIRQEIIQMINSENLNKNRLNQFRKTKGYREVRYEKAKAQEVFL